MFNKNFTIDYLKFKIPINSKVPFIQWKNEENYQKVIDVKKYNYGITNNKNKIPGKTKKTEYNCDYIYDINIEQAKEIIDKLPLEWSENRDKWLCVLTCLKNLNIDGNKKLFEDFSKLSTLKKHHTKEALEMNEYQWLNNHGIIDFNYLVLVVNKECKTNYPLFFKYKQIILKPLNFKNIVKVDSEKLKYDYKYFEENENIVAQSTTGSGKTYNTAENCIEYLKANPDKEIISIVYLQTLADQHIQSFYKDGKGIVLNDYRFCKKQELNENLVICLNSLLKLDFMTKEQMKNKIIYIDEFDSFNNYLTHNPQLDKNIKLINNLLMKLIINAHKVIVYDARIDENINHFFNNVNHKKSVFINNTFKKYKNVKAIRYLDENDFISKLKEDIKNNNYFLFGCDSCSKITNYFNEVKPKNIKNNKIDDNEDDIAITKLFEKITSDVVDKSKFLLITSKTALKNANEEFKNKFVFFSPSIVTGLDFSIDEPQNQFLYINSLTINSQSMFQQATRTRNIKNLYFFGNQRQNDSIYESIDDVKIKNKSLIEANNKIKNVCLNVDINYNEEIVDNSFYNQWCVNEYKNDCYNTNKIAHFENILKLEGFKLEYVGKNKQIDKFKQKIMTKLTRDEEENNYKQFINDYINEFKMTTKNDIFEDNKIVQNFESNKNLFTHNYKNYLARLKILPLNFDELTLDKFGNLIMDEFEFKSYFNILKLFKTNEYIISNIDDLKKSSYENKILNNIYNKIFLLRQYEKIFNITPFDLNFNISQSILKEDKFTDDDFKLYAFVFRSYKKTKPNSISYIRAFYTQMIKNIVGCDIIKSSQPQKDGIREREYKLNKDIIIKYYNLSIKTNNELNYDYDLLKFFLNLHGFKQ